MHVAFFGSHALNDTILLVDDDPGTIQLLGRILDGQAKIFFATNGADALRLARESQPDLILLDAEMPDISGFEVCRALKTEPNLAEIPVIFVTSHREPALEIAGFEAGAADFISKPVSAPLVRARVQAHLRMKQMADELRRLSTHDGLTGIANRRLFDEALRREWLRGRRSGQPIALLMVDVDHFKLFNDHYGHPAGDACLQAIAQAMVNTSKRPTDLVARYGGEEFALLLPETDRHGATHLALALLDSIDALHLAHAASPDTANVSISVGVGVLDAQSPCWSTYPHENETVPPPCSADNLVKAADKALYAAKHAGRAQACMLSIDQAATPAAARKLAA